MTVDEEEKIPSTMISRWKHTISAMARN